MMLIIVEEDELAEANFPEPLLIDFNSLLMKVESLIRPNAIKGRVSSSKSIFPEPFSSQI
jgi:hypothetical protein